MKRIPILLVAAFAVLALTLSDLADAGRMGGGRSFGAQRQSVTPSKPAAAAPSGASRWLGPIAGIAAGLGLAALLSHFGLSEGFGSLLLIGLVVVGGIFLFRMLMARREAAKPSLQYANAGTRENVRALYDSAPRPVWSDAPKTEPKLLPAAEAP